MLYVKVVLGLPIDGPFDYLVPPDLEGRVKPGARVWVNFRNKKEVAYIVGSSVKSKIKKVKEISALIDAVPILEEGMLLLTKRVAEYYCCSWGEAIESALPEELRRGIIPKGTLLDKQSLDVEKCPLLDKNGKKKIIFLSGFDRMPVYLREIKEALAAKRSAIVLFSDIRAAESAGELIEKSLGTEVYLAFRKQPKEAELWERLRRQPYCVVVGTRSSIFSPVNNPGLIIIDQPEDRVYKQEQVPHYHTGEVALMRAEIENAKVILASHGISLESFYLEQENKLEYEYIASKRGLPEVKVIDLRRLSYAERKSKSLFSKFLADAIYAALAKKSKVLIVINRRGFATSASCHNCGATLKCPACNTNLVHHFDEDKLKCHHCSFKMELPNICPSCNAGYIKYSGIGTEKVESELSRIFPQAAIRILVEDKEDTGLPEADILVSTGSVIKHRGLSFDLIGVMAIDNLLNRVDFRASEKAFSLLTGLVNLTSGRMIIQSANFGHYCFHALIKHEPRIFLAEELKQRRQLNLPPYKHMILVKLRGRSLEKVKEAALRLSERLNKLKSPAIKVISLNCGEPPKLRGNFYYQILIRASRVQAACRELKLHLKESNYSGIIVTVDVDPV